MVIPANEEGQVRPFSIIDAIISIPRTVMSVFEVSAPVQHLDAAALARVCDTLGKKYGVKSYCDHKQLLQNPEVDAVVGLTNPFREFCCRSIPLRNRRNTGSPSVPRRIWLSRLIPCRI